VFKFNNAKLELFDGVGNGKIMGGVVEIKGKSEEVRFQFHRNPFGKVGSRKKADFRSQKSGVGSDWSWELLYRYTEEKDEIHREGSSVFFHYNPKGMAMP